MKDIMECQKFKAHEMNWRHRAKVCHHARKTKCNSFCAIWCQKIHILTLVQEDLLFSTGVKSTIFQYFYPICSIYLTIRKFAKTFKENILHKKSPKKFVKLVLSNYFQGWLASNRFPYLEIVLSFNIYLTFSSCFDGKVWLWHRK